ncbi:sulfiredoxin, chloroplastic mitochondrial [Olea europaea subsp. europaea]|uniref:Sulfiredoxin n=1 Tax=Olea europaea subsp. europaea TaxID=158383 RepID=A0A8S0V3Q0_OLEEU|nr:sulfiredoxin, chloroplastic mitochondrial [Olea europaea subsp. europaea]
MANLVLKFPNNLKSFSVSASASSNGSPPGVHQSKGPVILELPLDRIRRPLMRTRANDPQKIDVLEVDGEYYGFSGCHRYEAHQKLGLPTIRCKVRRGTKETLRHHLR